MKADFDSIHEITPPAAGDPVFICGGDYNCEYGEIIRQSDDDDDVYIVQWFFLLDLQTSYLPLAFQYGKFLIRIFILTYLSGKSNIK